MTQVLYLNRPTVDRLVARALVLALDPAISPDERVENLARIAQGDHVALHHAVERIERQSADRPSPYAAMACAALRSALNVRACS